MAIHQRVTQLKLRDDDWKALGVSRVEYGTIVCEEGLTEGKDFEIDYFVGRIRRLRVMTDDEQGLFTLSFAYDDREDERKALDQERADALATVLKALPEDARPAFALVLGVEAIKQMP